MKRTQDVPKPVEMTQVNPEQTPERREPRRRFRMEILEERAAPQVLWGDCARGLP